MEHFSEKLKYPRGQNAMWRYLMLFRVAEPSADSVELHMEEYGNYDDVGDYVRQDTIFFCVRLLDIYGRVIWTSRSYDKRRTPPKLALYYASRALFAQRKENYTEAKKWLETCTP